MNNTEQWIKWTPNKALERKYSKKDLILDMSFRILAEDELKQTQNMQINFEEGVSIFRVTDIAYCSSVLEYIDKVYGDNFHNQWTFFKVINSEYIKWLHAESFEVVDLNTNHYAFVFTNCIVDVIECSEPEIKLIK